MASQPLSPDLAPAAPRGWRIPARAISPLVLLLAWELGSRTGLIPPRVLAAPTTVVATFVELLLSGELLSNLAVSLGRALAVDEATGHEVPLRAPVVVLAMGGLNGGHDETRRNWPRSVCR